MQESLSYKDIKDSQPTVYVIQDIPGTKIGAPKINIIILSGEVASLF